MDPFGSNTHQRSQARVDGRPFLRNWECRALHAARWRACTSIVRSHTGCSVGLLLLGRYRVDTIGHSRSHHFRRRCSLQYLGRRPGLRGRPHCRPKTRESGSSAQCRRGPALRDLARPHYYPRDRSSSSARQEASLSLSWRIENATEAMMVTAPATTGVVSGSDNMAQPSRTAITGFT